GRCVAADAPQTPPGILDPSVTPGLAKAGDVVSITFTSSAALARPPVVRIGDRTAAIADAGVGADPRQFRFNYLVLGLEPEGSNDVTTDLVDTTGSEAPSVLVGKVLFDFTRPSILSFTPITPSP